MPPLPPAPALIPDAAAAAIAIAIANDDTTVSNDVYRRETFSDATGIRIATDVAPNDVWVDHTVASGVDYSYRVFAVDAAGGRVASLWVTDPTATELAPYPSLTTFPSLTLFPGG